MALIQLPTRGVYAHRLGVRLDDQNQATLKDYLAFLRETSRHPSAVTVDLVFNQLIDHVLARDRPFRAWQTARAAHTATAGAPPRPPARRGRTPGAAITAGDTQGPPESDPGMPAERTR